MAMDPNSVHQVWSRWTATVTPTAVPPYAQVRDNCARFYRQAFGSVSELQIVASSLPGAAWTIDCRTEGHPAHDPTYVAYMTSQLRRFLLNGFGPGATVAFDVRLEAGDRQDGSPPDQLILGPAPIVLINRLLRESDK